MSEDLDGDLRPDRPVARNQLRLEPPGPGSGSLRTELAEVVRARLDIPRAGVAIVVVLALGSVGWLAFRPSSPPPEIDLPLAAAPSLPAVPTTPPAEVTIHVTGRVAAPGVYTLPPGSRVRDALDAAGGASAGAALERLNLAGMLADGAQVWVPGPDDAAPDLVGPTEGATPGSGSTAEGGPVDLNNATAEELDRLPGIGPATAAAIISHREQHGPFRSVDGLIDVRGIGEAKLEQLRPLVRV